VHNPPEALFTRVTGPLADLAAEGPARFLEGLGAAVQQLDEMLGKPDDGAGRPAPLLEALDQSADQLVAQWGQQMAELAVRLIEQPEYRLAGAEEALRQAVSQIEKVLSHYETLARELSAQAAEGHRRLQGFLTNPPPLTPAARGKPSPAAAVLELVRHYPKWRYHSLVLQRVLSTYVSLRGHLSDQLREINFCRSRLADLQRAFDDAPVGAWSSDQAPTGDHFGRGRVLFPTGCQTLDEAVQQSLERVSPEELRELDGRIQQVVRQQFTALVHICLSSANHIKDLEAAMQREAEAFVEARLTRTSVTEMYLAAQAPDAAADDLAALYDEAAPDLAVRAAAREHAFCILALPPGEPAERFREQARQAVRGTELVPAASPDDIVFYRELSHVRLTDLEQLGPVAQDAYRQMTAAEHFTPHARSDIVEWRPVVR
jgi:hypothetical protein